ncbi:hypothetical protein H0H93_009958 [Arthromyces matolae]|nr:hypothetical protein H0H93_009958 [Arthromyces matolae]
MVWSSAQPKNVFDMVKTCFPTSHPSLLRVWARDRMSLPPEQYRQKVSTVKNLEKVWFELRSLRHSLYSTLLMDDSADKAKLQPYNHLIVPEYQESIRNVDLEVLRCESKVGRANEDYDDTLLCVIGILEAVKQQQNVANWIRKGGLVLEETQDTPFRDSNTQNWWQIPEIKKHWRQEGLLVLDKLQIQLQPFRHGRR